MTTETTQMDRKLGAIVNGDRTDFCVWAPKADKVELILTSQDRAVEMTRDALGYHIASVDGCGEGDRYLFRFNGMDRPDPASRYQPEGVHKPSQVVTSDFHWTTDRWLGRPLNDYIIYELHVGTFTPEGTFESAVQRLDHLVTLGVTAVELMPIAAFPGARNWGYDGVYPSAALSAYGGPSGLRKLVDACHRAGLAVILDVVYNHLGPEGNYLRDFGPYFTEAYKTPWGAALNFDGPNNDGVRRFFIESALYWLDDCRIDALRFDAIHAIFDQSAKPFLSEVCARIRELGLRTNRQIYAIAESDLNDARVIRSRDAGGFGFDSQWSDDFHHALHSLLTGEKDGYYADFGSLNQFWKAYVKGWAFDGDYSAHRERCHGNSPDIYDSKKFTVCIQNHDQVGNRMKGERIGQLVNFERQKLGAAALLTAPFLPLLFMGEEYGETAPFLYFVSHGDAALVDAVRKGRADEFKAFSWKGEPPDPQSEDTFRTSKLDLGLAGHGAHKTLFELYRELIRLRRETPALHHLSKDFLEAEADEASRTMWVRRWFAHSECFYAFNFSENRTEAPVPPGKWLRSLDTAEARWSGPGSGGDARIASEGDVRTTLAPLSFALFLRQKES